MPTGPCPFNRPRCSSVDVLVESSATVEPTVSSLSKTHINRNEQQDRSEEASYLVIGGGEASTTEDYTCGRSCDNVGNKAKKNCFSTHLENRQMRSDKPETSSNSTTFTLAPSVSSSSSSAPSSVAPLSPVSMDHCDLRSPSTLHDSAISRLIDAVSLGNENDTCGSISALIGQFDSTVDHNDLTTLSNSHKSIDQVISTTSHHSNIRSTTPCKALQNFLSPLINSTVSNHTGIMKRPVSPQKETQRTNRISHEILSPGKVSQPEPPAPPLLSSPETTELEEVYTILDEEVLLPVSVYNLKEQTVHLQADTMGSKPSNSLGSSPVKVSQGLGKKHPVSDIQIKRGRSEEAGTAEENVYEEVYDPTGTIPEPDREMMRTYMNCSLDDDCYQFFHDTTRSAFTEVEINVDEDPLDVMLTSPRHGGPWGGFKSPTKRHAIYQKNESTPMYPQQNQPPSYCDRQQQHTSHTSRLPHSQCSSPLNQPSYQPSNHRQLPLNSQHSAFHRPIGSRVPNPSPQRQNSYPIPQRNPEGFHNNRDFSRSYTHSGNQNLNRSHKDYTGYKEMKREPAQCFHNSSLSSENLAGLSGVPTSLCRERGLYSPTSDFDTVYSRMDYDSFTPSSESSASHYTPPHIQSQTQSDTPKQPRNQKVSLVNNRHQSLPESQPNLVPFQAHPQSGPIDSTAPSPCKSKSLGDLTSEDISCNFQSKYHIISRSFITPHMRNQRKMGAMRGVTSQSQSCDPLTEQLRKLVSLEGDDSDRDRSQSPLLDQVAASPPSQPQLIIMAPSAPGEIDDSPPLLTRRLSSRSQSRVRHINSRARERQQEALKTRSGLVIDSAASIGGVVLRNKPASQNPPVNRHSTGSYIAGYLGQLEDRGLPEGACTSLHYGYGDHYQDRYYTDDSLPPSDSRPASEPEVYFLLRL